MPISPLLNGVIAGLELGIEDHLKDHINDLSKKFEKLLSSLNEKQRKDLIWMVFHKVTSRKIKGLQK